MAKGSIETASKRAIQNIEEATGALIGNEIADKITEVSKLSPRNISETVTNEHNKEIPKNDISLQEKEENNWWVYINIKV